MGMLSRDEVTIITMSHQTAPWSQRLKWSLVSITVGKEMHHPAFSVLLKEHLRRRCLEVTSE